MEKYTIDIYLVDESGFETNTTLYNLSLSQLMKLYALTTVLKFTKKSILIHSQNTPELKTNIEDFIILSAANQLIQEIKQHQIHCHKNTRN